MEAKGILFFALILSLEIALGSYCYSEPDNLSGTNFNAPKKHDSIFCRIAGQAPEDDGPWKPPYTPINTSTTSSSGATGATGPIGSTTTTI